MTTDNNEKPLISICIPTYNAARTIANTLESVVNQTYTNMQILVVDNVSSDDTISIVSDIKDPRIKIYRNERNLGGEGNFTRCIELAEGEYTTIFHADDIYKPEMVRKQVEAFQNNDTVVAVSTMAEYIDEKNNIMGKSDIPSELKSKDVYNFEDIFISVLQYGNFLICPSFMVKTEIYKKMAPFNGKDFRTSADLDMWLRISKAGPVMILKEHLMKYRTDEHHFTYHYEYLRTEIRNFFRVMDHHLQQSGERIVIPSKATDKYKLIKSCDEIVCAINLLIKNETLGAKNMLKNAIRMNMFHAALRNIQKPKYFVFLISGTVLLFMVSLRIWNPCFSRILYKLRYDLVAGLFY